MKKKPIILCTLGPSTLNKKFLRFINKKANLVRINMSHVDIKDLKKKINFIKKNCKVPICIDTEGGQIRTKIKGEKFFKKGSLATIQKNGNFNLYPTNVFNILKKNDILDIGFDNLKIKVLKIFKNKIICKTIQSGYLENNKGVHITNRKIHLNYLTDKDLSAIEIGKKLFIKNYALSFTNNHNEIKKFNLLLPNCKKIFKIETGEAINNLSKMFKHGKYFLIDRGDLSKEVSIEKIPLIQRYIFNKSKSFKKVKIFVATNYLESMLNKPYPTRGEANDIYSSLEMGADGLVLAAETAVGKYPEESINFLIKMIKSYKEAA
jgi:pyruvate kinase